MSNELPDPFDALDEAEARTPAAVRKLKKPPLSKPLERLQKSDVRKVEEHGKSVYHGRLPQVTFRISEEYVAAIEKIAANEGLSKEEVKRWVVGIGLQAYSRGERPEVEERVVKNQAKLPKVKL